MDGVQQRLKTQTSLEAHAAASALAASSFLDQLSSSQVPYINTDPVEIECCQGNTQFLKSGRSGTTLTLLLSISIATHEP